MTAGATTAALMLCLAAAGCAGAASGSQIAPASAATATAPSLTLPTVAYSSATPAKQLTGPPTDPFAGTPAEGWAYGAADIVLPAAKPVGNYSAAQVELAYQWTKKLLVAANLDPQTLAGGTPTAFANLLTNYQRTWFVGGLNKKGLEQNGAPQSTRWFVMSFAPGSTQLIGDGIKVHGTMSAKAVTASNGAPELDIDVDYLFVYAAEPPHHPEQWMRLIDEEVWDVEFAQWQGAATAFEPFITFSANGGKAGASCGTTDGYVHPDWPTESALPNPSDSGSGAPLNPYVAGQNRTVPGCQANTGT